MSTKDRIVDLLKNAEGEFYLDMLLHLLGEFRVDELLMERIREMEEHEVRQFIATFEQDIYGDYHGDVTIDDILT